MNNYNVSVDMILEDVMMASRDLIVEEAVDEYILAEKDILIEATTYVDRMVDIAIDEGYDEESQYLEDDEEINAFIDDSITEDIEDEEDLFQNTIDECDEGEDFIEDIEDVTDYDDLDSYFEDDDIDSLID